MLQVKSLQRGLIGTTVVVGAVVSVVGWRVWRDIRERTAAMVSRVEGPAKETPGVAGVEKEEECVVTRVLVKRRVGHPEEEGQVVETQYLGKRRVATQQQQQGKEEGEGGQPLISVTQRAKGLPMGVKVAVFGGMVAAFVGFNAWAVPRLMPQRVVPSFEPVLAAVTTGRSCFVEVGCGDGRVVLEAAKHFDEAHGFERRPRLHRAALKQLEKADAGLVGKVHIHGAADAWEEVVGRADCVLVPGREEQTRSKVSALMKRDSLLLLQEQDVFVVQKID